MTDLAFTDLHKIAFKYYNHIESARDDANFILSLVNEDNLQEFTNLYTSNDDFGRKLSAFWNKIKPDEYPSLTGTQEDMMKFLLNMYLCERNRQKRAKRLKRGFV